MKIIALIADDSAPEGRTENHDAPTYNITLADAQTRMERMVKRFNETLRPGELPRRLLSVQLVECTARDAFQMGKHAFEAEDSIEDNFWPESHPLNHEWRDGYKEAEAAWVDSEDEEFDDE